MHKTSIFLAFAVSSLLLGGPALAAEDLRGEGVRFKVMQAA